MPRAKRRPKKRAQVVEKDDSDIDASHGPDPESEEFFYDDVDKFHSNREKILLDKSSQSSDDESEEFEQLDEVLGLDIESDEDDDIHEEDLSGSDEDIDKGIPSEKAWGKKKNVYYDADQQKEKDLDSEEEEALDKEEEDEVLMLQQNMAARLDEDDFDIEEFELANKEVPEKQKAKDVEETAEQEKIIMDLSKLSKEEKIKLLAKDSPELFELMGDLKEKLNEVTDRLYPLVQLARAGKITNPQGVEYLEMKHQLVMNYLVNVCFYLLLKAHQTPVKNHPVIERLVQYRELLQKLEPLDAQLHDDIEHFLEKYRENITEEAPADSYEQCEINSTKVPKKKGNKKKVKFSKSESASADKNGSAGKKRKNLEDLDPLSYYEAIRDMKKKKKEERLKAHTMSLKEDMDNIDEEEEEDADGKRGITYQISKNKGLTPKRKKEVRNPRLKHRKKFVKAKIKRKSQVNPVVKELSRYGGESTGIKSHLTRGVRIK